MATPLVTDILGVMRSLNTAKDAYLALESTAVAGPDTDELGPTVQADCLDVGVHHGHRSIRYALKRRVIVVAAAGNDHGEDARETAPANVPGVIVVGATQADGHIAPFSNVTTRLPMPIAAPGADIVSVETSGQYVTKSGTSMATPLVAGILGVMRSLQPNLTAKDAYLALRTTAVAGPDTDKIGPTVQAGAAVRAIIGR
jgi:thermitase